MIDLIYEMVTEDKIWYHGTPDVRELRKSGIFQLRTNTTNYVPDPQKWVDIQAQMKDARNNNEDLYFKLLDQAGALTDTLTYNKPIYFTGNRNVANTYADPKRALNYQKSEPTTLRVTINDSGKILKIPAHGIRFREISVDVVRQSLNNNGVPDDVITQYFDMFPHNIRNGVMSSETLGIIAQRLGFDIVDIIGVLDSYHGGDTQSTVRMVFDPNRIKII